MPDTRVFSLTTLPRDIIAGLVVFLVALPLCLGVALASNAPLISGLLAGIVGGIVVGILESSRGSLPNTPFWTAMGLSVLSIAVALFWATSAAH